MKQTLGYEEKRKNSFLNYIISFFIYSVVLWVYNIAENWVMFPPDGYDINWILRGPYAVYAALEVMAIMGIFALITRLGKKADIHPTLIFLIGISVIGFALFEYFGSWAYEAVFKTAHWDYDGRIFNINGRVCGERIIMLTIIEVICVYVAQPFINKSLTKVKPWIRYALAFVCAAAVLAYTVMAFI